MRMRKKRHGSERLASLAALLCENPEILRTAPASLFENPAPLRLEIGCGKGDFIRQLSRAEADCNYFAMEKIDDVLVVAMEKYAMDRELGKLGCHGGWDASDGKNYANGETWDIPLSLRGNVRFLSGDAKALTELFAPDTFQIIYANFSDPWPKSGYEDRRLTAPNFLTMYAQLLQDGGMFKFKTDNADLFAYSLETVKASPFELTFVTDDLHASECAATNIMTEYERNFSEKGVKIHALDAVICKK